MKRLLVIFIFALLLIPAEKSEAARYVHYGRSYHYYGHYYGPRAVVAYRAYHNAWIPGYWQWNWQSHRYFWVHGYWY